jgi:hypothetical protein
MRVALLVVLLTTAVGAEPIKAFCVDFNWGPKGINGFAGPGVWATVKPEESLAWHRALGANVIQTFAVSCNGYAWYRSELVPPQPGLASDFLTELVRLGHAQGVQVMGYFCVGANTRWAQANPELSYGTPSAPHLPLTTTYLDFLCASIADALRRTGMDGFMIDWVWNPNRPKRDGIEVWLPAEQAMFAELLGTPFPGADKLTAADRLRCERAALDRCWRRLRDATRQVKPDALIWLSCHNLRHATVVDSALLREVDWLMNENPNPADLVAVKQMAGPRTTLVQCLVGWGDAHDAGRVLRRPEYRDLAVYGFVKPGPDGLPLPVATYLAQPIRSFRGNDRNIAVLARWFNGLAITDPPEVVTAAPDGTLKLLPQTAVLDGFSPVVTQGQIGNWEDPRDTVSWRLRVARAGEHEVVLVYACPRGQQGSVFAVELGDQRWPQTSVATGATWREYQPRPVGRLHLAAGEHTLTIRPDPAGPWRAISLQAVELRPVPAAPR